jgi:hypothetical protein
MSDLPMAGRPLVNLDARSTKWEEDELAELLGT